MSFIVAFISVVMELCLPSHCFATEHVMMSKYTKSTLVGQDWRWNFLFDYLMMLSVARLYSVRWIDERLLMTGKGLIFNFRNTLPLRRGKKLLLLWWDYNLSTKWPMGCTRLRITGLQYDTMERCVVHSGFNKRLGQYSQGTTSESYLLAFKLISQLLFQFLDNGFTVALNALKRRHVAILL